MSKALVHLDPDHGPVGVWCVGPDTVTCFYDGQHLDRFDAGAAAVAARGDKVPFEEWFERLTERLPYGRDVFVAVIIDPAATPEQIYSDQLAHWKQHNP